MSQKFAIMTKRGYVLDEFDAIKTFATAGDAVDFLKWSRPKGKYANLNPQIVPVGADPDKRCQENDQ